MAVLYFTVRFRDTQSWLAVCGAGIAALCGTLTRYDGWFLIPFVALFVLVAAKRQRVAKAALFAAIACLGPLYWLGHNWWCCSNVLDFYNGPYSAKGIQGVGTIIRACITGPRPGCISARPCAGARARRCYGWARRVWLACAGGAQGLVAGVAVAAARECSMCGACTPPAARRCSCRTYGRTAITTRDMGWRSSPPWPSARRRWCRWSPARAQRLAAAAVVLAAADALADPSAAGCLDHLERIAGQFRSAPRMDARGRRVSRAALPARARESSPRSATSPASSARPAFRCARR